MQARTHARTLQGVCKLLHVAHDEAMELLACPNGADHDRHREADAESDGYGAESPLSQRKQLLYAIARHRDQIEGENKYGDAVVEPGFDGGDELGERRSRS